jgi:hypothetical protein
MTKDHAKTSEDDFFRQLFSVFICVRLVCRMNYYVILCLKCDARVVVAVFMAIDVIDTDKEWKNHDNDRSK